MRQESKAENKAADRLSRNRIKNSDKHGRGGQPKLRQPWLRDTIANTLTSPGISPSLATRLDPTTRVEDAAKRIALGIEHVGCCVVASDDPAWLMSRKLADGARQHTV